MIPLKSEEDLERLKASGLILARVMRQVKDCIKAGVTTLELDAVAARAIAKEGAIAAFKGYQGYPANICVSINEEIVHGIPSLRKIEEGDLVSLDIGVNYNGYFSDAAVTVGVGKITPVARGLIDVAGNALFIGVEQVKVNNYISDISSAIQAYVEKNGFSVVRQFVGHGIGRKLHEEPEIPNFGKPGLGERIKSGMVFAIEPMVNVGGWECKIFNNGWTAVTCDGLASAHFEHTVAVTEKGPQILTEVLVDG